MKSTSANLPGFSLHVMDQELNKKKHLMDNFIYNCSHGIRSPLKTMEGLVRLVKDHSTADTLEWQNYMALIGHSAERLQAILSHFQELKRNAESEPIPVSLNLQEVLFGVLKSLQPQMQANKITSRLHINQKGEMAIDSWRFQTIVKTLFANAITFYDEHKNNRQVSVFVTASASSCSIQVHDNGAGIPLSEQTKIFNLFHRGTHQSKGSGMGLFVAQQLTQKLNGTLSMQSIPGQGSVFSLWLPNQSPL